LLREVNICFNNVIVSLDVKPYDLVNITQRYILEHSNLHTHCHKNKISHVHQDHNALPTYTIVINRPNVMTVTNVTIVKCYDLFSHQVHLYHIIRSLCCACLDLSLREAW